MNVQLIHTDMKIVLDTNCLIMAISSRNIYHIVWKSFLAGKYTLCVSNEIVEEYVEVVGRNISPTVADMDDNKFVDCAINSGAMFIVTEDHHFNVLKQIQFPHVDCIGIDAFIEVLCHQD